MEYFYNNPYASKLINSNSDLIKIELDKEFYLPGETIQGSIMINCIENIRLNTISISLLHKECWFVQETTEVKYGEKYNQSITQFNIDIKNYIKDFNEILVSGNYVFPFKIDLPHDLEPCFEYPYPNRYAYLRYLFQCELLPKEINIKSQKYILIKSASNKIPSQKFFSSIVNVHKWGFFDGGTTMLKASYDKINYKINDVIPINIDIDNSRGKLKVKNCKIRIIRTIQFNKLRGPEKYPLEKTIYSKQFNSEVLPFNKGQFLFQIQLKDDDLINLEYLIEENPYPNIRDINLLVPSIDSKILKCFYRIQVSLYFDSFVTSGYRPRVKLPIFVTHFIDEENNNIINNINVNEMLGNNFDNFNDGNYSINDSSLIYDQNFMKNNNQNSLINNINENEKNDSNNDLIEYIKSNKIKNQNNNENNNIKPNYIELKNESFYNINEI